MQSHGKVKKDKMKKAPTIHKKKTGDLEPELRLEFIEKIKRREKQKPIKYDF